MKTPLLAVRFVKHRHVASPWLAIFVLVPSLLANSAPVQADDLYETYLAALRNDARFSAAQGAHAAGVEKHSQGISQLLPSLSANGEKTYAKSEIEYEANSPFESGKRDYEDLKYSATLTQPIYRKQNFAAYWQGKAQKASAEAQFDFAKQDLILRVAQAYFDLLSAQQVLAAAAANTAAMKIQEERANVQMSLGSGSRLEASEARSKHELAKARELSARHDLTNKQQALRRITDREPGPLNEIGRNFQLVPPTPNDLKHWLDLAQRHNSQLRSLFGNMKAAKLEVIRAQSGHYPNLDLVAQYSNAHSTGSVYTSATSDTLIKSAGLRLEVPLFQGWLVTSRTREAVGNYDKARGELEDARRDVNAQVIQNFNGVLNGIHQVQALQDALSASREAARANRIGLEVGSRNLVDLLNAQQQVFEVTRDLVKAQQDYVLSYLKLLAQGGQLSEGDIVALNKNLAFPIPEANQ